MADVKGNKTKKAISTLKTENYPYTARLLKKFDI